MKFLHIAVHFEFADDVTGILDRHGIGNYARYPMVEGKDRDGKHCGSQVFPGSVTVVQAQVPNDRLDVVLASLREFKRASPTHEHLEALVLAIERRLDDRPTCPAP